MLIFCYLSLTLYGNGSVFFPSPCLTAQFYSQPLPLYLPPGICCLKWDSLLVIIEENHNSAYLSLILVYFLLTVTSSFL